MSDSNFWHQDVEEIKRHIDRSFADFERRAERKAESERARTSMRRSTFHFTWMALVIVVLSIYNNWDFWASLFGD
jgi:cell division septal protein FtsQ